MYPLLDLLRSARFLLGLTQGQVEKACQLQPRFVYNLEGGKHVLMPRSALIIKAYYEREGVVFFDGTELHGSGIRWKAPRNDDPTRSKLFRAARGLADLSQDELANQSGVGRKFIATLEQDALVGINPERLRKLEEHLKALNIEMIPERGSVGAGVRWISDRENTAAR